METTTFPVRGMTCGHCVSAVTAELKEVPGVQDVTVDLVQDGDSPVTVTSERPIEPELLEAAVTEAGYTIPRPAL